MFQQYIEQVYEIDIEQMKTGTEIKEQKIPGQRKKNSERLPTGVGPDHNT